MKRLLALAVIAALVACADMRIPGLGDGWETLIDGEKGLENFDRVGDANWRAEGGAIVADRGKSGFLLTKKSYKDFEIRAEFYAESDTNSGIYIRCNSREKISGSAGASCYEVNIWDTRPDPKFGTGAIVDVAAVPVPIQNKAGGHWNTYEVIAKGPQMTAKLNGVQTSSGQDARLPEGWVGLQYATGGANGTQGGPIKWRKVQIRPL